MSRKMLIDSLLEQIRNTIELSERELIEKFLEDMIFDGECYKISIKNHNKWEERSK